MHRKHQAAAVAIATMSVVSAVQAQGGITLYGLADAGIEFVNHAGADGTGNRVRLGSGTMNTSRIGFRGAEDLGGGLKALVQLESGWRIDTGAAEGGAGQLFNRQANVGLDGSFGRLIAGRSFSTTYDFMLPFDPMGYSANYSWLTSAGATGGRRDGMPTGISNLIKYQNSSNGVKFGAMLGLGEVAGAAQAGARYGFGLGYGNGPLSLAATYDLGHGSTVGAARERTETLHLGAACQWTPAATLIAGFRQYRKSHAAGLADARSNFWWGGARVRMTPAVTLTGAVYYQRIANASKAADPVMVSLRLRRALSGRTDLYASTAYARARHEQLVGLSRDEFGMASSQFGLTMGVQHRF